MRAWNSTLHTTRQKPTRGTGDRRGPFRSDRLRRLAAEAPHCMACGLLNDGTVVGAHSNSLRDGKGMGQKSHDVLAYLCRACHDLVDGRIGGMDRAARRMLWLEAAHETILWLLQSGHLEVLP